MPGLYMSCSLCDRRQADGLLSRGTWGHIHLEGAELHACPTCKQGSNWEDQVRATLSGAPSAPSEGFPPRPAYPQTAGGF
jgi:ribosome-binding protein aMBF1 (putative translation factor)